MTVRTRVIAAAAAATLLAGTVTGCELLSHIPAPTPDPPKATATETETAQERIMRLDQSAAEQAYLAAAKESDQLAIRGGANSPTAALKNNAGGAYLDFQMQTLRQLKQRGYRIDRPTVVTVTANRGWSSSEVGLTACEDASKVRLLDRQGREVLQGRDRRFVQLLTASKVDGRWKITASDGKAVKSFDNESGCQS